MKLEKWTRALMFPSKVKASGRHFRYLGNDVAITDAGYRITHIIEAAEPTAGPAKLFCHFQNENADLHESLRFTARFADTPDTTNWKPGTRLELTHTVHLVPGAYELFIGFVEGDQRLPITGSRDGRASAGSLVISPAPQRLEKTPPLRAADPQTMLQRILDLPTYSSDSTYDHIMMTYGQAPQVGHVMEFGVASGSTIRAIASVNQHRQVWGFDSFEGLPEDWVRSSTQAARAGTFSTGGQLPPVPDNVHLVKGWFSDTLPKWLDENPGNVAFLHVDVDLYSSTKYVLDELDSRIVPGTIIVWDDLGLWEDLKHGNHGSYEKWEQEEWRAMIEWLTKMDREIAPISRLDRHVLGTRVLR